MGFTAQILETMDNKIILKQSNCGNGNDGVDDDANNNDDDDNDDGVDGDGETYLLFKQC